MPSSPPNPVRDHRRQSISTSSLSLNQCVLVDSLVDSGTATAAQVMDGYPCDLKRMVSLILWKDKSTHGDHALDDGGPCGRRNVHEFCIHDVDEIKAVAKGESLAGRRYTIRPELPSKGFIVVRYRSWPDAEMEDIDCYGTFLQVSHANLRALEVHRDTFRWVDDLADIGDINDDAYWRYEREEDWRCEWQPAQTSWCFRDNGTLAMQITEGFARPTHIIEVKKMVY